MACGKPIVASIDGEGAKIVNEAGAGLACTAENPEELAKHIVKMYSMSSGERERMGEKGKIYCLEHFNRDKLFDELEVIMEDLIMNA